MVPVIYKMCRCSRIELYPVRLTNQQTHQEAFPVVNPGDNEAVYHDDGGSGRNEFAEGLDMMQLVKTATYHSLRYSQVNLLSPFSHNPTILIRNHNKLHNSSRSNKSLKPVYL